MMKTRWLLLLLVATFFLVSGVSAQASMVSSATEFVVAKAMTILTSSNAEVGYAHWQSFTANTEPVKVLDITLRPWKSEAETLQSNFGIDLPLSGEQDKWGHLLGAGVSETAKIGTVIDIPIRAGVGYMTGGLGACWFVKTDILSF